jgi:signal transduction histidine kinase
VSTGDAGRWLSPLAVILSAVVLAAALLGFVLTEHSVSSQNQALLKSDVTKASVYVSSLGSSFGSTLEALASGVTLTGASPAQFESQASRLAGGPTTIVLAHKTPAGYVVSAAAGPGYSPGQLLTGAVGQAAGAAGRDLSAGPASYDGRTTTLTFLVGPPLVPRGIALLERLRIDPFLAVTAVQAAPFHDLSAAVYAGRRPNTSRLVLANTRVLPVRGTTIEEPVSVGATTWWIVGSARSPLVGGFANAAPYVVLGVGALLALGVLVVLETLVRRHRYATSLVAARTAELDASHAALVRSERLSAVGEMASVIGHELRNPLASVMNAHFMLRHTLGRALTPEAEQELVMAERQTARAAKLADDLTAFVRERDLSLGPVDLAALVEDVLGTTPPPAGVNVTVHVPDVVLSADGDQLGQVLANLITNALQAMPAGGALGIEGEVSPHEVVLRISDTGAGIDLADIDRVFDPFFTTRPSGTGLGLAIVARIIQAHGGSVTLENGRGGGAVAKIRIPAEPSRRPAPV